MVTIHSIAHLQSLPAPLHLAIGVFDGVHLGHRAVIERALASAGSSAGTAVIVTFDPHPARVLRPGDSPLMLTSTRHKELLIERLGAAHLLVIAFTRDFAATPPADFIRQLPPSVREICVGEHWAFGKNRAGDLTLLKTLGAAQGFDAVGIPDVEVDGQPVSSTAIRGAVAAGKLDAAARMLGREFGILGTVVERRKLGRTLGFPTANLESGNEQLPPDGVYAVGVRLGERVLRGVANIGVRPTVEDAGRRECEVHLFDFDGEIYGLELEVTFVRFLRGERKFPSVEELKAQIARDVKAARE